MTKTANVNVTPEWDIRYGNWTLVLYKGVMILRVNWISAKKGYQISVDNMTYPAIYDDANTAKDMAIQHARRVIAKLTTELDNVK